MTDRMTLHLVYYTDCLYEGGYTIATYETHEESVAFAKKCVALENRARELKKKHGSDIPGFIIESPLRQEPDDPNCWTDGMTLYAIHTVKTGVEPPWHMQHLEREADEAHVIELAALLREDEPA